MNSNPGLPQPWAAAVSQSLAHIRAEDSWRTRRLVNGACAPRRWIGQRELLCFNSNDYLGLAAHPEVVGACKQAAERYGVGAGAAQAVSGYSPAHEQLEQRLAVWQGRPRALLFSTGYMANISVLCGLTRAGDEIIQDKLNHASLLDGAMLSRATLKRFPHRDLSALGRRLSQPTQGRRLVVTDSVFSMHGHCAPLTAIADQCHQHEALLAVDEAHAIGVVGPQGQGLAAARDLSPDQVPLTIGTLGKALGTFGAFVTGPEGLIELLIQQARPLLFTTALPPAVVAATDAALTLLIEENWRREKLTTLIHRFRRGAQQLALPLGDSDTAIQTVDAGSNEKANRWSTQLEQRGIWVPAIRPPTVPKGCARLRVTLSALHQESDVDRLLLALEGICNG